MSALSAFSSILRCSCSDKSAREIVEAAPKEKTDWEAPFAFPLKLGDKIRGADVQGHRRLS